MSDFLQLILYYLTRSLVLIIPALLTAGAALFAAAKVWKKKRPGQKFPWAKALPLILLGAFLIVVLYVTLIRSGHRSWRYANLHLFRAWREAWNTFSEKHWLNVLLNVAMFVPLGLLLPLLTEKLRRWHRMLAAGFGTSLAIEVLQYILCRRLFDVDDLLCNTLGAMIGYWFVMVILPLCQKRWKQALPHLAALLAVGTTVGGIFLAYEIREFGNFPESPPFQADTSDVIWTMDFQPEETPESMPLYALTPPDRADCEALGRAFLDRAGVTDVDVTYYNEEVYLREHQGNRILEVFYPDGSLDYWDLNMLDPVCTDPGEELLREELKKYGITVPEGTEYFTEDDGSCGFTADFLISGDAVTDGTILCQYQEGYGLIRISNSLRTLSYYDERTVCSPEEAINQVKAGWLRAGDYFERLKPEKLEILSCSLTYRLDTKGFYRPVYIIELVSSDGRFSDIVMIPAMT